MNRLPTISIVIPSFNQGRFLRDALESIFRQDYPHLEVVVMDGGSTDESVDIIRTYESRVKYWQSRADGGQAAAINEGMRHCTGDLVAWLNSDDFYWEDALWMVGRSYVRFPNHGLYIGNGLRFDQREEKYTPFSRRHIVLNREALINGLDYILQPSTFFLRRAWNDVQGLITTLHYCMDWDLLIRIAKDYPAVLINEFLAVSREYEETKTSSGKMGRIFEIIRMVQPHAQKEITPGGLFYLSESLLDVLDNSVSTVRHQFHDVMNAIGKHFADRYGNHDGFPESGDPQDNIYVPIASKDDACRHVVGDKSDLPSISVITPSYNQAQFLAQTLESVLSQNYPKLETLVFDNESTDGSVEVLKQYENQLTYWVSEPDRGPAHAINKGIAIATGEIIAWLNSDDMLTQEALWRVAQAFADDPELDMVFANALYIDESNKLYVVNHGSYRTGLYYGEMQPLARVPAYWSYVHAIPQPTVFFRRRLLNACGPLDESYHFIFDFELFWRFLGKAKINKLERTLAFYRIHAAAKTSNWNNFLIELYRFSRPWWPSRRSPQFRRTLRDFVSTYMRRRHGHRSRGLYYWTVASLVGFSAITKLGNPEAFKNPFKRRQKQHSVTSKIFIPPQIVGVTPTKERKYIVDRTAVRYRSIFCSFLWPRHPGHSGGEIRDFHLVRHLLTVSHVDFFYSHEDPNDQRDNPLAVYLDTLNSPTSLEVLQSDNNILTARCRDDMLRVGDKLVRSHIPLLWKRYHRDALVRVPLAKKHFAPVLQKLLETKRPDFLFVSPQFNPVALTLAAGKTSTRLIMATYDVEAIRINRLALSNSRFRRLALKLEGRRAVRFERENLSAYDGIIAVSDLDKDIFLRNYDFDPERVLSVQNCIDPEYFAFADRQHTKIPIIAFVASFSYLPNGQAAQRLVRDIMPLVRKSYPEARVWIVGQNPDPALVAQSDGRYAVVTGKVDDVRPYLAAASVACVPLIAGSGTKYKVLEAMSAGVPVVCTPLANEGLDLVNNKHLVLGETDSELAAAIVRVLDNPDLGRDLATKARAHVVEQYSWDSNLTRLDAWLPTILSLPKRSIRGRATSRINRRLD